jgi:hypothetical protein
MVFMKMTGKFIPLGHMRFSKGNNFYFSYNTCVATPLLRVNFTYNNDDKQTTYIAMHSLKVFPFLSLSIYKSACLLKKRLPKTFFSSIRILARRCNRDFGFHELDVKCLCLFALCPSNGTTLPLRHSRVSFFSEWLLLISNNTTDLVYSREMGLPGIV